MRICNNLNTSICFNYKDIGITYCTLTNASNGKGWPKISDNVFDGEKINWTKFFEERSKEIEAIKNGCERHECKDCQQITDINFCDDRKIHYVLLSPWQICNSNCIYCLGHAEVISAKAPNYYEYYKEFTNLLSDIYQCRNMNHRGNTQNQWEKNTYDKIIPLKSLYYFKFLGVLVQYVEYIKKGLGYIPELKKYSDSIEKQKISAPQLNIVGQIDLKDDGRKRFK